MEKVLSLTQAVKIAHTLKKEGKKIILIGGCFDLLHIGHVEFLAHSKNLGGVLMVLLESDQSVRKHKGVGRPIQTQKERATILSKIHDVDYVVLLPLLSQDMQYYNLVKKIKPDIIAITKGDSQEDKKRQQAEMIHGTVVAVMRRKRSYSTSGIIERILRVHTSRQNA